MTPPRKPRDFREELIDLKGTIDELLKDYPDAYDYGYWPAQGGGSGRITQGRTDPTSATFAIRGRVRGLLTKTNSRVNAAIMALEDAHEALDDVFDQGVQLRPEIPRRPMCTRCGKGEVRARGLCNTCLEYKRRTGRERPERLVKEA